MPSRLTLTALPGIPEIAPGDDLAALIADALARAALAMESGDVLVVAQKVVSKNEGRFLDLATVTPSARAIELARATAKDPRLVEAILAESVAVLRHKPGVIVVEHRCGFVMANAGIDRSNIGPADGRERVLLLPLDPDASAERLRAALASRTGSAPGVIVSDSFGRAWRNGVVNVALGAAGLPALADARGRGDRDGRTMQVTQVALADAMAAAAGLVMGEGDEGAPVALLRGGDWRGRHVPGSGLVRDRAEDMFR